MPKKMICLCGLKSEKAIKYGLQISVWGFSPGHAENIFYIFQRLHGKKEYEGAGIGLATSKKIVQNHDGIYATSAKGHGATFHVILPK